MEYLGIVGSSRMCSFYADGDGDFRPKVSFDYPESLPKIDNQIGLISGENIREAKINNTKLITTYQGDFLIDPDQISQLIQK